jgi:hypothetical protein
MSTKTRRGPRKAVAARRAASAEDTKYDDEALSVLAYEFRNIDPLQEAERKIKRRLREKKLGAYDAERFAAIRRFKDELQDELHKADKSDYYTGRHGRCADPADFDHVRLIRDLARRHPTVAKDSIARFVPFAVYIYYLR